MWGMKVDPSHLPSSDYTLLLLEQRFNTPMMQISGAQQTYINTGAFYGIRGCHSCRLNFPHVYSKLNYVSVCFV